MLSRKNSSGFRRRTAFVGIIHWRDPSHSGDLPPEHFLVLALSPSVPNLNLAHIPNPWRSSPPRALALRASVPAEQRSRVPIETKAIEYEYRFTEYEYCCAECENLLRGARFTKKTASNCKSFFFGPDWDRHHVVMSRFDLHFTTTAQLKLPRLASAKAESQKPPVGKETDGADHSNSPFPFGVQVLHLYYQVV